LVVSCCCFCSLSLSAEEQKTTSLFNNFWDAAWMNLVERFFRDITVDCVRDGSFASVHELEDSILDYLNERNLDPKPYVWKAEGKSILEKISRARAAMSESS